MRNPMDLLFIHVPKFSSYYRPYGEYMTVNLIPMGTFALADLLVKKGYTTEILHLGLERMEPSDFSLSAHLAKKDVKMIAISLHWHQQSYDVMKTAQEIKQGAPEMFIVLGGYTASFFHQEILNSFPQIDAVIRGDAEVPLPALIDVAKAGNGWETVPNLSWRDRDQIRENPLSYVAGEKDLEGFSYANLNLLKKSDDYVRYMGIPFVWSKGLSKAQNRKFFHLGFSVFPLNIGRGCTGNCTWCGGGASAQYLVNGRKGVVFRSPESVVETVAQAVDCGYEMMHIAFDPQQTAEDYFRTVFFLLRKKRLQVRCYFESFSLPSETFLRAFSKTFIRDGSRIALSPETGNEPLRFQNKSFAYSNAMLKKTISAAQELGICLDIFFAMGIPGETVQDLAVTRKLRRDIQKVFNNIGRTWTSLISLEPASPWHMDPDAFGIVSARKTFDDFYRAGAPAGSDDRHRGPGYHIPDYMGNGRTIDAVEFERLFQQAKCRDHCSLNPDPAKSSSPFWGRLYCRYMHWRTGGSRG